MNDRNLFLTEYSSNLTSSRRVIADIVRLLNTQEETIQRCMNLPSHPPPNVRREFDTPFFPRRTPRSRIWNNLPNRNNSENSNINELINQVFTNIVDSSMNPVIVRPSQDIINRATENLVFSDLPTSIQRYQTCPISHEPFTENSNIVRIRHCGHYFGRDSFNQWFNNNVHCPICRHDIRENLPPLDNNSTSNDNLNNQNSTLPNSSTLIRNVHMSEASGNSIQDFINVITNDLNQTGSSVSNDGTAISYQFDFTPQNSVINETSNNGTSSNDRSTIG